MNELPGVLWAYRITFRQPIGATPFTFSYEMENVIPIKVGMPTTRMIVQGQRDDNQELKRQLDWEDEIRENAAIQMASYRQRAIAHYNKKSPPRIFHIETLLLRRFFENTAEMGAKKLQANWEGPYIVTKVGVSGAYHLQTLDGVPLLHLWNVSNLKQYY